MQVNIEVERVRNQLSKDELSSALGISTRTYSNYITEQTAIPSDVLIKMARLFHCKTDYLLGLEGLPAGIRQDAARREA